MCIAVLKINGALLMETMGNSHTTTSVHICYMAKCVLVISKLSCIPNSFT